MSAVTNLLPAVAHLGVWGYWALFALSFVESLVLVGQLIPGLVSIAFFGFMAANGLFDFGDLVWFSAAGALAGDWVSFVLGTRGTDLFNDENRLLKASHLDAGERFFKKHGGKSILLARGMGPLRPMIPFVAGLSRMEMKTFLFWDLIAAFFWSAAFLALGFFFGAVLGRIEFWAGRVGYLLVIIVLLVVLWRMASAPKTPSEAPGASDASGDDDGPLR